MMIKQRIASSAAVLKLGVVLGGALVAESNAGSVTMGDPIAGGIGYRAVVDLGEFDTASFTRHVGAWSWQDDGLSAGLEDPVGWTHTSDWVALRITTPVLLTLKMERQEGVSSGPTTVAPTTSMFPSFTIWSGWDNDDGDSHMYNNDGAVSWAEDITYLGHVNNNSQPTSQASWALPAGDYTIVLGSNAPSSDTARQGYLATFTTVPEPSSALSLLAGFAVLCGRFRSRRNQGCK